MPHLVDVVAFPFFSRKSDSVQIVTILADYIEKNADLPPNFVTLRVGTTLSSILNIQGFTDLNDLAQQLSQQERRNNYSTIK